MPRFKLTIEYAGTKYSGWQIQKNARTVQGEVDSAVREVTRRQDFELYGSGRTDAGVHALAQVAHLDVVTTLAPEPLQRRLNDELPADINILSVSPVPHRFHARHHATGRRYLYQIATRRTAFAKPFVWWIKDPLDVARMRDAASRLVGMRNFGAFAERAVDDEESRRDRSTLVLLESVEIAETDGLILIAVEGSHFLWKMVRRIVGVLAEIGRGKLPPETIERLLEGTSSDVAARLTASASGLFLERVYYQGDQRENRIRPATPLR